MGLSSGQLRGDCLKFWNGPELGDVEGILVGKIQLDPGLEMWTEIWSSIFIWMPAGASGRTLAWRVWKGISLGSSDGDMVVSGNVR